MPACCTLQSVGGVAGSLIPPDALVRMMSDLLETPMVNETVGQVLEQLLDIQISVDEQCLHLAVSTPSLPSTPSAADLLPVLVFIYGGAFRAGTQYKMGYERMGEVNDFVHVAINYRLGPLGLFVCF